MDTNKIAKQALQDKQKGRRNTERPRKRWKDQLHLEVYGVGTTANPSESMTVVKYVPKMGRNLSSAPLTLNKKVAVVMNLRNVHLHLPEDRNVHLHLCDNIKSHKCISL